MATIQSITAAALRKLNVIGVNEVPTAVDVEQAQERLNALLDSRSNELTNIFKRVPLVFLFENNQYSYDLGPTGDWVTERPMRLELSRVLLSPDIVTSPTANFTSTRTDLTIAFVDASTFNPTSWLWDFGDGSTSTTQDPTHTYATAGNYLVSLTVANSAGTDTKLWYVQPADPPVVGLWQYNGTAATMQYASAYGAFTDVAGEFDSTALPTGGVLYAPNLAYINQADFPHSGWVQNGATFKTTTTWDDDGTSRAFEMKLLQTPTAWCQAGIFIQSYGPPYDPNTMAGGPLSSYLATDQYSAAVYGYGGVQSTLPPLVAGDVVGVVNSSYSVQFYVNGVYVSNSNTSNNIGFVPMCGVGTYAY
jgi:PKD repeat protein